MAQEIEGARLVSYKRPDKIILLPELPKDAAGALDRIRLKAVIEESRA